MATPVDAAATAPVDEAIARVLEAERAARAAVAQCVEDAEAMRQAARARAQAIAERAAERAAVVHRRADASIRARIEELNRERTGLQQPPGPGAEEPRRLARALDRLADELAGGAG